MPDELTKLELNKQPDNPMPVPGVVSMPVKKSNKTLWIIVAVFLAVMAVMCICSTFTIASIISVFLSGMKERAPVELVLDTFMSDMEAKDVEGAFDLFSPRAQRQMTQSDLKDWIRGNNYVCFDGYQNLSIDNIKFTSAANTNPNSPQGIVVTTSGTISYRDGFTGTYTAVLEKVEGVWMLYKIDVTVPPNKLQNSL
jgi:hypothetical protein